MCETRARCVRLGRIGLGIKLVLGICLAIVLLDGYCYKLQLNYRVIFCEKSCNLHIRALHHVRKVLSDETVQMIACSIMSSRIDYCNAILYSAPESLLDKLQRTQNDLAKVVCW